MKKILSLGVAAAVLSMTAVAASALVEPTFTATPVAGEEVTVEIVANNVAMDATSFTIETTGLTYVDSVKTNIGYSEFNPDKMLFAWMSAEPVADGTVLLTLTFTVDAAADEDVAINLVPDSGITDVSADAVVATVVDSTPDDVTDPDDPTDVEGGEGEDGEGEDGEGEDGEGGLVDDGNGEGEDGEGDATDGEGDATDGDTTDDGKGNPDTGIALAVVPAVLAGAAIVVAKKRK